MGLVAWGETHIDSSVAGIAQATVPIFTFLLGPGSCRTSRWGPSASRRRARFVGVALLAGLHAEGGWWAIAGRSPSCSRRCRTPAAASTGSARFATSPGPVLAAGIMLAAAHRARAASRSSIRRASCPGTTALAGLAALILIPTFAGQLLLFRVLRLHGSRKLSIVTYLMPAFAVAYGALLLDEPVTGAMLAGFALIVVGVALASGQRFFGVRVQEEPA